MSALPSITDVGQRIQVVHLAVCLFAGLTPDVTPHVLRHTAATWLMQQGVNLWEAAGYVGMTAETLERHYGHHHPDYLQNARAAIARQKPDSYLRTEREPSVLASPKKREIAKKAG